MGKIEGAVAYVNSTDEKRWPGRFPDSDGINWNINHSANESKYGSQKQLLRIELNAKTYNKKYRWINEYHFREEHEVELMSRLGVVKWHPLFQYCKSRNIWFSNTVALFCQQLVCSDSLWPSSRKWKHFARFAFKNGHSYTMVVNELFSHFDITHNFVNSIRQPCSSRLGWGITSFLPSMKITNSASF